MFYFCTVKNASANSLSKAIRVKGRGACSNECGRYEPLHRHHEDDGWDIHEHERLLKTEVSIERPRKIISFNKSPDIPFDRSVNPYRGCEHGCIYCFARPTHAYLGLSPGLDFETRLIARPQAGEILEKELSKPGYRPRPIAIGTNTDPYQPIERKFEIMRSCLEVLDRFSHPVGIITKGTMIERDTDLISKLANRRLARVGITVTTLDPKLSRLMEPRVPSPARRMKAIETLAKAGIPVRLMVSPVVPGLNDHEIEAILKTGLEAGASAASWIMIRLPLEVSPLFQEWLAEHFPDRASKVMKLVREMHNGRDYDSQWGRRMRGCGHHAEMIANRFKLASHRLGLDKRQPDMRADLFKVPFCPGPQMEFEF